MSKKNGKFAKEKKKPGKGLLKALLVVVLLAVTVCGLLLLVPVEEEETVQATVPAQTVPAETETAAAVEATEPESGILLGNGLRVLQIGSYTGLYMEDGTDEVLNDIVMLLVRNDSGQDVQYAKITMPVGDQTASFALTTLPADGTAVVLEENRMPWDETVDYSAIYPSAENTAFFQEPVSLMEDRLKVQIVDGALNVTNISGEDIPGTVTVYYKNFAGDIYYGGITYRVQIQGGLKAEELRQVMTKHASDTGSKVMFVTVSQ